MLCGRLPLRLEVSRQAGTTAILLVMEQQHRQLASMRKEILIRLRLSQSSMSQTQDWSRVKAIRSRFPSAEAVGQAAVWMTWELTPQDLSNTMWAFATLQAREQELLEAAGQVAVWKIREFYPQEGEAFSFGAKERPGGPVRPCLVPLSGVAIYRLLLVMCHFKGQLPAGLGRFLSPGEVQGARDRLQFAHVPACASPVGFTR